MRRAALALALLLVLAPGCHRPQRQRPRPVRLPAAPKAPPARVLILHEEGPGLAEAARELAALVAHFEERCAIVPAGEHANGLEGYAHVFYLAGAEGKSRPRVAADLARFDGTVVWVGPGVEALGAEALGRLAVRAPKSPPTGGQWALSYRGQAHPAELAAPAVEAGRNAKVWAELAQGNVRRPFLIGRGKLWYAAAGPLPGEQHFWGQCVWGDLLHEVLATPHQVERRLVPALRDVPVWVSARQAPDVVRPVLKAGLPVAVLAAARTGEVLLSDRPAAARALREVESLGAVVVLVGSAETDPREQLRLAWELGLHPLAWSGPGGEDGPFRLRVADPERSPPFSAGGLLPAAMPISDAGYVRPQDAARLHMLRAVRDAVALVSFGLWAPPEPFVKLVQAQREAGWKVADLRDLRPVVTDPRRTVLSGGEKAALPAGVRLRKTLYGPRWQEEAQELVSFSGSSVVERAFQAPPRSVVALEPVREMPARPLTTGVTLDPWSYVDSGVSAETLAQALAERYSRNGVNTVFFYAYNVNEGAAYRTRYPGATLSDWGRQDLLGHLIEACRARGIRVVAWLYSGRDRGAWMRHPSWRERTADGKEYNPLRLHATYFLCPRNPGVREWYAGLVRDLARRYPTLDGIELCEPVVNWWGDQACHCETCEREFARAHPGAPANGPAWRRFRARGLTEFLSQCLAAISGEGVDTYIMTITDAWSNGAILSPRRQAEESGFDLDALLDGPHPPDWVNFELIWQQWAAIFDSTEVFNPGWAADAAQQLTRRVDGRARVMLHVELTDFGARRMTPADMEETIRRASAARPAGIECYHSRAIDQKAAWGVLKRSFEGMR